MDAPILTLLLRALQVHAWHLNVAQQGRLTTGSTRPVRSFAQTLQEAKTSC
jgi:hypothetical protein